MARSVRTKIARFSAPTSGVITLARRIRVAVTPGDHAADRLRRYAVRPRNSASRRSKRGMIADNSRPLRCKPSRIAALRLAAVCGASGRLKPPLLR